MSNEHIIILTGAGVSAPSGLSTFRGAGGVWRDHDVMKLATPEGFAADPDLVHTFYNDRRANLARVEPNAAHKAIAKLQVDCPGRVTLITQNVDDLHERGGSPDVIHMHGSLLQGLCMACDARMLWTGDMNRRSACPKCGAVGSMRPDVVWFGEIPHFMDRIADAMETVTTFISIGTSGEVYPAANFLSEAKSLGAYTLEFNLEPSARSGEFHESHIGPCEDLLPKFVEDKLYWSLG
ncbi:MAG: NAD-dependent deacylase [Pseudomonadota bacterium]